MEHGARLSTSRVMAIAFIFMSVLIVLSLSVNVIQGVNNYRLQNEQRTAVTPMAFNAPFAVSQNSADASYLQQMALSFIALRLNVSSETVDASHQALLQYIRPGAQNQMKVILAEEAKRIKNDNVNSAFFQTSVRVWPQYGRVEIRGVLKTWIGDSKPFTDIKHYILILKRENGVFARQGEVMNPLQYVPFNQTLYFINGDDPAQVAWMKRQTPPTLESKIILVQGSIPEMQKSLDSRVYFDQNGVLCQRLGIDQVPARVSAVPGDRFLKVEFIPAEEGRK